MVNVKKELARQKKQRLSNRARGMENLLEGADTPANRNKRIRNFENTSKGRELTSKERTALRKRVDKEMLRRRAKRDAKLRGK